MPLSHCVRLSAESTTAEIVSAVTQDLGLTGFSFKRNNHTQALFTIYLWDIPIFKRMADYYLPIFCPPELMLVLEDNASKSEDYMAKHGVLFVVPESGAEYQPIVTAAQARSLTERYVGIIGLSQILHAAQDDLAPQGKILSMSPTECVTVVTLPQYGTFTLSFLEMHWVREAEDGPYIFNRVGKVLDYSCQHAPHGVCSRGLNVTLYAEPA